MSQHIRHKEFAFLAENSAARLPLGSPTNDQATQNNSNNKMNRSQSRKQPHAVKSFLLLFSSFILFFQVFTLVIIDRRMDWIDRLTRENAVEKRGESAMGSCVSVMLDRQNKPRKKKNKEKSKRINAGLLAAWLADQPKLSRA